MKKMIHGTVCCLALWVSACGAVKEQSNRLDDKTSEAIKSQSNKQPQVESPISGDQDGHTSHQLPVPGSDGNAHFNGGDPKLRCDDKSIHYCRKLAAGIYQSMSEARLGRDCRLPDDPMLVAGQFCQASSPEELVKAIDKKDGEKVAVRGRLGLGSVSYTCVSDGIVGHGPANRHQGPTSIVQQYELDYGKSWKLAGSDVGPRAGLAIDVRNSAEFRSFLPMQGKEIILHGTLRYQPIAPPCGDGSVLHHSGFLELATE